MVAIEVTSSKKLKAVPPSVYAAPKDGSAMSEERSTAVKHLTRIEREYASVQRRLKAIEKERRAAKVKLNKIIKHEDDQLPSKRKRGYTRSAASIARDEEIRADFFAEELTYEEMAAKHGITRQRIEQIVRRLGLPNRIGTEAYTERQRVHMTALGKSGLGKHAERDAEILKDYHANMPATEIAKKHGLSYHRIRSILIDDHGLPATHPSIQEKRTAKRTAIQERNATIRSERRTGATCAALAAKYKLSLPSIYAIVR